jgi:putative inorganic carbon (hco3(-)) transporter
MLSEGGAPLFVMYLLFVAATGAALVRAIRRRADLLVMSVAGAWLAYQVQSLVSFDVPSLAVMHWLLAGVIVLLARGDLAESDRPRQKRRSDAVAWQPLAAAGVAMLVVAIPASIPLRADIATENANELLRQSRITDARNELERATDLAPWEGLYWARLATVNQRLGQRERALTAGIRAATESPGAMQYALGAAQLAASLGKEDVAASWYAEAVARNPREPGVLAQAAEWNLEAGRVKKAVALFERADAIQPGAYADRLRFARRALASVSR